MKWQNSLTLRKQSAVEPNEKDKEDKVSDDDLDSLKSFIDDSEVENDRRFY